MFFQSHLYLPGIPVRATAGPSSTWHPPPLRFPFQRTRYAVPINDAKICPYIPPNISVTMRSALRIHELLNVSGHFLNAVVAMKRRRRSKGCEEMSQFYRYRWQ